MPDDVEEIAVKPASKTAAALKRFFIALAALVFVWLLFGILVPHLLYPPATETYVEQKLPVAAPAPEPSAVAIEPPQEMPAPTPEPVQPVADETPAAIAPIPAPAPAPIAEDTARLSTLEAKIAAQEAELAALKSQLATQQTAVQNTQEKTSSTLSALVLFGQMKDAIKRGEPYATSLQQLKTLTQAQSNIQESLSAIAPNAEKGVVPLSKLQSSFSPLLSKALAAKGDDYKKTLSAVISVRKVGEPAGNDDESKLARAETALAGGDMKNTLKEIAELSPPVKAALSEWDGDAKRWFYTEDALNQIQLSLTQDTPKP